MTPDKVLVCVVGPTGIGKTTMGIALARALDTEIISADSRQFYKEMSIGTAVPTPTELASVKHHFIQHLSIFDSYTVGDFERDALGLLDELFARKDHVVMVGGSGLYVDAVIKGLDDFPKIPASIRNDLLRKLEAEGLESLQQELKAADRASFDRVDIQNKQRLIRALEICRGTGKPYSSFLRKEPAQRPFKSCLIGLTASRETVYERINQRVDKMMKEGLEEEARALYPHAELNALQTVGYKELFAFFHGRISRDEAVEEIKKNSRRYAKRQGTWFRKNEAINWFDHQSDPSEIIRFITNKKDR